jgi:hypothetical protein
LKSSEDVDVCAGLLAWHRCACGGHDDGLRGSGEAQSDCQLPLGGDGHQFLRETCGENSDLARCILLDGYCGCALGRGRRGGHDVLIFRSAQQQHLCAGNGGRLWVEHLDVETGEAVQRKSE